MLTCYMSPLVRNVAFVTTALIGPMPLGTTTAMVARFSAPSAPTTFQPAQAGVQRPVILQEVDPIDPPEDLAEFVARANAVVHVRILNSRTYLRAERSVITEHTAQIVEALKGHPTIGPAGSTILVAQDAGSVDLGDRIVRVAEHQPFRPGETYVLFLHWNPTWKMFEVLNAHHGAFKIGNGGIDSESHSALAESIRSLGSDQLFISALRALAPR